MQHALSSEALSLFPDFQQRLGVLRRYVHVRGIFPGYICFTFTSVVHAPCRASACRRSEVCPVRVVGHERARLFCVFGATRTSLPAPGHDADGSSRKDPRRFASFVGLNLLTSTGPGLSSLSSVQLGLRRREHGAAQGEGGLRDQHVRRADRHGDGVRERAGEPRPSGDRRCLGRVDSSGFDSNRRRFSPRLSRPAARTEGVLSTFTSAPLSGSCWKVQRVKHVVYRGSCWKRFAPLACFSLTRQSFNIPTPRLLCWYACVRRVFLVVFLFVVWLPHGKRAGILSALIFQEKTQNEPPLTDRLQTAVAQVPNA